MQHQRCPGAATLALSLNTGWREEKGALLKEPLSGGAGGGQNPPLLAPSRPEFRASATSSSLDVLSQVAGPTSLKTPRGLCHQARPTTRSVPPSLTHTHAPQGLLPACRGREEAAQAAGLPQGP